MGNALKIEINVLNDENNELKNENNKLKIKNMCIEQELTRSHQQIDKLKEKNDSYEIDLHELKNRYEKQMEIQQIESTKKYEDEMAKLKQKHDKKQKKIKEKAEDWKQQFYSMKEECDEMRERMNLYEGESEQINAMNMAELNALRRTLQETIFVIETAKEKLDECVICKDNQCNIAFIGCGHCVLCEECEQGIRTKVCPQCQISYSDVLKISR